MSERLLRIRVSLKGRPVRAFAFAKDLITVGRDPGSDVFLDNPGVSREHCRIGLHPSGSYAIEDLDSANGLFVDDQQVKMHFIRNNDVVHVGKFALWFAYDEDRRGEQADAKPPRLDAGRGNDRPAHGRAPRDDRVVARGRGFAGPGRPGRRRGRDHRARGDGRGAREASSCSPCCSPSPADTSRAAGCVGCPGTAPWARSMAPCRRCRASAGSGEMAMGFGP